MKLHDLKDPVDQEKLEEIQEFLGNLNQNVEEVAVNFSKIVMIAVMLAAGVTEVDISDELMDVIDTNWLDDHGRVLKLNLPEEFAYLAETKGMVRSE